MSEVNGQSERHGRNARLSAREGIFWRTRSWPTELMPIRFVVRQSAQTACGTSAAKCPPLARYRPGLDTRMAPRMTA